MPKLEHNPKQMHNKFSQYVKLLMQQTGLSATDVERQSKGKISNSYVSKIARGRITNITIEALGGLAEGLDIDAYELFAIAYGKPPRNKNVSTVDPLLLLAIMQKMVMNPQLIMIVQELEGFSDEQQGKVLESLKLLNKKPKKKSNKKR
jgi:transcriptional regulator with XRE-family HTH domain